MASEDILDREPDPLAAKLLPSAGPPADLPEEPGPTFVGFFDRSGQTGCARLNFPGYAHMEFKAEDVVEYGDVPPDQSPVFGERATHVRLKPDALVEYVRDHVTDEFEIKMCFHNVPANELFGDDYQLLPAFGTVRYVSRFH